MRLERRCLREPDPREHPERRCREGLRGTSKPVLNERVTACNLASEPPEAFPSVVGTPTDRTRPPTTHRRSRSPGRPGSVATVRALVPLTEPAAVRASLRSPYRGRPPIRPRE